MHTPPPTPLKISEVAKRTLFDLGHAGHFRNLNIKAEPPRVPPLSGTEEDKGKGLTRLVQPLEVVDQALDDVKASLPERG